MGRQSREAETGLPLCDGIFERDLGFVRELDDAAPDGNDLLCRGRDSLGAEAEAAFGAEAESAFGLAEAPTTKPNSANAALFTVPRVSSSRMLNGSEPSFRVTEALTMGVAEPANGTATHGQGD